MYNFRIKPTYFIIYIICLNGKLYRIMRMNKFYLREGQATQVTTGHAIGIKIGREWLQ